jgi:adenylate cyclase
MVKRDAMMRSLEAKGHKYLRVMFHETSDYAVHVYVFDSNNVIMVYIDGETQVVSRKSIGM